VIDAARPGDGGADGFVLQQVALDDLDPAAFQRAAVAAPAGEDADGVAKSSRTRLAPTKPVPPVTRTSTGQA
jgi:hypothetical protein